MRESDWTNADIIVFPYAYAATCIMPWSCDQFGMVWMI
jgi:hypothetical protein